VIWGVAIGCLLASIGLTRLVLGWLRRKQILDLPNERSSHSLPTPRGGGLAVTPVMAAGVALIPGGSVPLALGALALMALSWIDDRRGLPAGLRFGAHMAVVAAGLAVMPAHALVFGGALPLWADRLVTGICWVWFLNLYNFMDGIDGITGVESVCVGLGLTLFGLTPGLAVAAAALGFLVWNWHPAKLFLGDSGSVPLGYVLGGLLIQLAVSGFLVAALILPAYYLADATITLLWRLKDGEKIWQAHRRHFYQRALKGGKSHAQVALAILAANLALIGAAIIMEPVGIPVAMVVVAALLALMTRWARA
jgi:UDP-N-acetylmuramyl pentapeptide phosphotransferase/UDP-N-acetylglucosamine-1-phosphate transferase